MGPEKKADVKKESKVLNIGDPAPELRVSEWIKGEKFEKFEPGKTYVVEFWATWCGPCIAQIPKITELAHKYKGRVTFIGVDVLETDPAKVKPFVAEMGDRMDYYVVMDETKGFEGREGFMSENWLRAADVPGIPSSFVVHDGIIADIGHPMELDELLEKVLSGKMDLAESAKKRLESNELNKELSEVQEKYIGPYRKKDYQETLRIIEEESAAHPRISESLEAHRLLMLRKLNRDEEVLVLGKKLIEKYDGLAAKRSVYASALSSVAFDMIDVPEGQRVDPRLAKVALDAIKRAIDLSKGQEPHVLRRYGEALFVTGDFEGALEAQEKSVKLLEARDRLPNDTRLDEEKARLEKYRKAVDAKAKKT